MKDSTMLSHANSLVLLCTAEFMHIHKSPTAIFYSTNVSLKYLDGLFLQKKRRKQSPHFYSRDFPSLIRPQISSIHVVRFLGSLQCYLRLDVNPFTEICFETFDFRPHKTVLPPAFRDLVKNNWRSSYPDELVSGSAHTGVCTRMEKSNSSFVVI